jgi:lysophospholipase L1-like esterase
MGKRHRRKFTDEFKAETVKLIRESGRTVASVARELDLTETAVRSWVKRAEAPKRRMMRSAAVRAALVLAAVAATGVTFEFLLRLTSGDEFLERPFPNIEWMAMDPVLGWRNRAGFRTHTDAEGNRGELQIDRRGFHVEPAVRPKLPGERRIACLGHSGTFGVWWEEAPGQEPPAVLAGFDSYPRELGRLLERRGRTDVEVINAGVLGYSSSHGLRQLMMEILLLDPDVITVRFGYNDHSLSWNPALRSREPDSAPGRALLYRFRRWKLARLALAAHQRATFLHPAPNSVPWASLDEFRSNLERFAEIARTHRIHLLFIDYPLRPLAWGTSEVDGFFLALEGLADMEALHARHAEYQAIVRQVAARESVPLLETGPALLQSEPPAFTAVDPLHLTPAGARVLAERLVEELLDLGWLNR